VPITIADVAAQAKVSKTTVSRVLNGKGELDESTAARVRKVIEELGYVPSSRAVGLARGRTRILGVLVPSLSWPWMGDVLQGVADVLEARGYGLLLNTMNRGEDSLAQFARHVSANAFDGLLLVEPPDTLSYIETLHESGLPVVMIDDRGHHRGFPSVSTSNRAGAASAAQRLVSTGRSRIAMITGPADFGCTVERVQGFRDVIAETVLVEGDFTPESGLAAIREVLRSGVSFDGVFAQNDMMAVGALDGLREAGRSVPADVAVIGFDDIALATHAVPALTTVRQPSREMGEAAATMLLDHLLDGVPLPEEPHVVPTSLVVRDSA
jgi:LacI family transcriptional regulator